MNRHEKCGAIAGILNVRTRIAMRHTLECARNAVSAIGAPVSDEEGAPIATIEQLIAEMIVTRIKNRPTIWGGRLEPWEVECLAKECAAAIEGYT